MRSPNPNNANNERNVNTSGASNNNNANNANAAAADCGNRQYQVAIGKSSSSHARSVIPTPKGVNTESDTVVLNKRHFVISALYLMGYKEAISFDELYKAGKECFGEIRWKDSTVGYEHNLLKNTYVLRRELLEGKYKISKYQIFYIYEPKKRRIVATRLRDRQLQRSLCNNGFYEDITRTFIKDNCACQVNKGTDYAIKRMKMHLRRYYRENGCNGWFLKCDIRHYFDSIDHDIAKDAVDKRVRDEKIKERIFEIIDSFGEVGIGLGSQISQLVALAVLDGVDHYIKEQLMVKHYIRYMDDFVLIHKDKDYLIQCRKEIEKELKKIHLQLNEKTSISPLRQGIKFLKWHYYITEEGRVIMLMDKKKIKKQKRKIRKILRKEKTGQCEEGSADVSTMCWIANAKKGNTFRKRKKIIIILNKEKENVKNDN